MKLTLAFLALLLVPSIWASSGGAIFSLRSHATSNIPTQLVDAAPDHFVLVNGVTLFSEGNDVYASDGTETGSRKLVAGGSYNPQGGDGSEPTFKTIDPHFALLGNEAVFSLVGSSRVREIWRTDGTTGGTRLLHSTTERVRVSGRNASLGSTFETQADNLTAVNGRVLWTEAAYDSFSDTTSFDWWATDGTVAGTVLLHHFPNADWQLAWPQMMTFHGQAALVFGAATNTQTTWTTDGTVGGTHASSVLPSELSEQTPHVLRTWSDSERGYIYRKESPDQAGKLYAFDGTMLTLLRSFNTPPEGFFTFEGATRFYLPAGLEGNSPETPGELWTTDGTIAGTVQTPVPGPISNNIVSIHACGPWLCIYSRPGTPYSPRRVWFGKLSTGSFQTNLDYGMEYSETINPATAPDGYVWLTMKQAAIFGVHRFIGFNPANPAQLRLGPGSVLPLTQAWIGSNLWLGASQNYKRSEPWLMNLTGTTLTFVADLLPQAGPSVYSTGEDTPYTVISAVSSGNNLFVVTTFGDGTTTLCVTDGRRGNIQVVLDEFGRAATDVTQMISLGDGRVEFISLGTVYRSDGTPSGTKTVVTVVPPHYQFGIPTLRHQATDTDTYVFPDSGFPAINFWRIPRSSNVPVALVAAGVPPISSDPTVLLFTPGPYTTDYGTDGTRYWPITNLGITEPWPGLIGKRFGYAILEQCPVEFPECVPSDGYYRFLGWHDGRSFQPLAPVSIDPINGGYNSQYLGVMNGNVYFVVDQTHLWRSNGTVAGTIDLGLVPSISNPFAGIAYQQALYFLAAKADGAYGLWKTTGTTAGTQFVVNCPADPNGGTAAPQFMSTSAGLYFLINTATGGQLWFSDGTTAGTSRCGTQTMSQLVAARGSKLFLVGVGDVQVCPVDPGAKPSTGWAMLHGLDGAAATPMADPDGDQKSNLRELLEATDPTSGSSPTGRTRLFSNGLCIPQTSLRHGLKVWLSSSDNLVHWTRREIFDFPEMLEDDCRFFPFLSDRFYRFEVEEL